MAPTPPVVYTNCYILVDIKGSSGSSVLQGSDFPTLLFNSFTPPSWSTEAQKHKFYGANATTNVVHGGARIDNWGTAQLGKGVDTDFTLYKWVQTIRKNGPAAAKADITITVQAHDDKGTVQPICQWVGTGAIITQYSQAASNASTNEILTESVTIDAETWDLKQGSGSPIDPGPPS